MTHCYKLIEWFNDMIWRQVPKAVFIASDVFKIRVHDAVTHFNIAEKTTANVLEASNLIREPK